MKIALHENDKTKYPNLVLMKLAAWHKARGDKVERYLPLIADQYDLIYSSKVFTWTQEDKTLPAHTIKGGTGYGIYTPLDEEIEHIKPDYSLYPHFTAGLGFTTRGCIRACPWCIVPEKEGILRPHADITEFVRPDSKELILMDNNILAHDHGLRQIEKSIDLGLKIDCNQGLDARIIANNTDIAKLLARTKWIRHIRLACDTASQMPYVEKAVNLIRKYGQKHYDFMSYVLVKDIPDALERVEFLRSLDVKPFAQPYRDFSGHDDPPKELRDFARWCNQRAIFNTVKWQDYKRSA